MHGDGEVVNNNICIMYQRSMYVGVIVTLLYNIAFEWDINITLYTE